MAVQAVNSALQFDNPKALEAANCPPSFHEPDKGSDPCLILLRPFAAGAYVVVDGSDCARLAGHAWHLAQRGRHPYAAAKIAGRTTYMHRVILGALPEQDVDHRNGNGLDNRRSNLRIATSAQNNANRHKSPRPCQSRYKGVCFEARNTRHPWVAVINRTYLGAFAAEEDAARAYDAAAIERWGEFARINFSQEAAMTAMHAHLCPSCRLLVRCVCSEGWKVAYVSCGCGR